MKFLLSVALLFFATHALAQSEREEDFSSPPLKDDYVREETPPDAIVKETPEMFKDKEETTPNLQSEVKESLADASDNFSHRVPEPTAKQSALGKHTKTVAHGSKKHSTKISKNSKHSPKVAKHSKPSKKTVASKSKKHSNRTVAKKSHSKNRTVASVNKKKSHKSTKL